MSVLVSPKKIRVFLLTILIIFLVGLVIFDEMKETLSPFTISKDETKFGITYLGNGQVDTDVYSSLLKVFEGDLIESPKGTSYKVLKVESDVLTLVLYATDTFG